MIDIIKFNLNDKEISYTGSASARLLDFLRDEKKMTGTKCGCKEGECGACCVIIDGKTVNSCLVAMGSIHGASIITIEGYSKTERFETLSKAFESVSAIQCGFCMPGMLLSSECILDGNPKPSETIVREGLSGNLCRCTGYNSIVKAVLKASEKGGGLW
ncbi:MAG: (2Fe-2S)-binding protein [Oscillospiraceae bacterium]|nr:(2Fe-2S)-binding protein [Oscillospiraceae bacterium]MCL2278114.1 (2Fe-2S)-binding protein [Oscillospiraceae bacterium]